LTLQIVEILSPSEQGLARPYKCRADDGEIYFVKGRQTTRACLWHEWICAHLAQRFGLQVPPFAIVEICQELLNEAPPAWRDLGVGPAFGSRLHPSAVWLEVSAVGRVPPEVQRDVLVFDWWVRNNDRQIGNCNLLWDVACQELVVIDHNQAFDRNFSVPDFMACHVFAAQWGAIMTDLVLQAEYAERLSDALLALPTGCDNVPTEWHWTNVEMDVPATFDIDRVKRILARCATPELWRTV
jgi:hypothetical protein